MTVSDLEIAIASPTFASLLKFECCPPPAVDMQNLSKNEEGLVKKSAEILNFVFHDGFWKSRVFLFLQPMVNIQRGKGERSGIRKVLLFSRKLNPIQQNLWSRAFELLLTFNLKLSEKLPKSRYSYRSLQSELGGTSTLTRSISQTFQGQKVRVEKTLSLSSWYFLKTNNHVCYDIIITIVMFTMILNIIRVNY